MRCRVPDAGCGAGCRVPRSGCCAECGTWHAPSSQHPALRTAPSSQHAAIRTAPCTARGTPHSAPGTAPGTLHPALGTRQVLHGFRPPAPAHRVLAARRRLPYRRAARPGAEARAEGGGGHRAREHVLVGGLPRRGAQTRHQPDSRLRGLCGARQPLRQERDGRRDREPSGPARGERNRVQEPDQAGVGRDTPRASTTSRASTRSCSPHMRRG